MPILYIQPLYLITKHEMFVAGNLYVSGKLLFHHKTFVVARDGPKDYACDGDY